MKDFEKFPQDAYGITSSIPIEVPLAAGRRVLDLNNRFVLSPKALEFVRLAEKEGYPRTCCTWIRGLYGFIRTAEVKRVIFVTGGDCSNTHAMMETLAPHLEEVKTFSYPETRDAEALTKEIDRFCHSFGTTRIAAEKMGLRLQSIRKLLAALDIMTWQEGKVSGAENHIWLVSSSDFNGDPIAFEKSLRDFLAEAEKRKILKYDAPRIGVVGVPPIQTDLISTMENFGVSVVYNEIPLQFAMLNFTEDLVSRYLSFTYPYGGRPRIEDIAKEASRRNLDGLIHYTQAFCHRQIHDILLRKKLDIPILTIEGDVPGECDQRTKLRLESFIEILQERRRRR